MTGTSYKQKLASSDNHGQIVWQKERKSGKIEQGQKTFISAFV